jgi:hypothetical protein
MNRCQVYLCEDVAVVQHDVTTTDDDRVRRIELCVFHTASNWIEEVRYVTPIISKRGTKTVTIFHGLISSAREYQPETSVWRFRRQFV